MKTREEIEQERDRLRDENERAAQLAVEATHLILRLREERDRLRAALEELVEAHDYWFSTGKGEGRAITATAKAKELLS